MFKAEVTHNSSHTPIRLVITVDLKDVLNFDLRDAYKTIERKLAHITGKDKFDQAATIAFFANEFGLSEKRVKELCISCEDATAADKTKMTKELKKWVDARLNEEWSQATAPKLIAAAKETAAEAKAAAAAAKAAAAEAKAAAAAEGAPAAKKSKGTKKK